MRPLKLNMTAFGPFAGTEKIDFTALGDNPLFLINGPTGAGKTTILDGICFALYGSTTGNVRDAAQMRCDHAAADLSTEVSLEFSLNLQHYRITRSPQQQRAKTRGVGFTTQAASAELFRVDGSGETTALAVKKIRDVDAQILGLTGLTVDQFRQVMVLPQGKFVDLLNAASKDREEVFGQLFDTGIYKKIEAELADRSRDISKQRNDNLQRQQGLLHGIELADENALAQHLADCAGQLITTKHARDNALKAANQAKDHYTRADQLQQDFNALQQAEKNRTALAAQAPEIKQQRDTLQQAKNADALSPLQQRLAERTEEASKAKTAHAESVVNHETAQSELAAATEQLQQARAQQSRINTSREQLQRLKSLQPRVGELEKVRNQLQDARTAEQKSSERLERKKAAQAGLDTALQAQQEKIDQLERQLENIESLQQQEADARNAFTLGQQLAKQQQEQQRLQEQLAIAKDQVAVAKNALEDSQKKSDQLELAWHQGQAAVLASKLKPNQPCAVCGSLDHPQPAQANATIPDDASREEAQRLVDQARQAVRAEELKYTQLSTSRSTAEDRSKEIMASLGKLAEQSLESLEARLHAATAALVDAKRRQAKLATARSELKQSTLDATKNREALNLATQAAAAALGDLKATTEKFDTAETELPEQYRSAGALAAAIKTSAEQLNKLEESVKTANTYYVQANGDASASASQLAAHLRVLNQAQTIASNADKQWNEALSVSVFTDFSQWQNAKRSVAEMERLTTTIRQYEDSCTAAVTEINTLSKKLSDTQPPDLPALQQNRKTAIERLEQAEGEYNAVAQRQKQLQTTLAQLEKVKQANQLLEQQYAVVGTLSDAANGKTGNRVSLHRFVLSVILDDVLRQASQRFNAMSKGRYSLYRKLDRNRGAGAAGLDLLVEDAHSGKQRDVKTLSGGESFMAALSLALGLSDIVQSYSGGIHLDTLFIDEGFGSLDPESLDQAINTLIDLQASGRMVGVISHVPELKERINIRLDVRPGQSGSDTRVVTI